MIPFTDEDGDLLEVETFDTFVQFDSHDGDDGQRVVVHLDRDKVTDLRDHLNAWLIANDPHPHGPSPEDLEAAGVQSSVAVEAHGHVYGARQGDYGHPREDFTRTAVLWTGLLQHKLAEGEYITPEDYARCMVAVKLSRDVHSPKRDNRVDVAGYAICLDRLETGR